MNEPTLQRTDFYEDGTTTTEAVDPPDGTTVSDWVASTVPFFSIAEAAPLVCLRIIDGFEIRLTRPMPCRWWRFWQRLLLGWRWEVV